MPDQFRGQWRLAYTSGGATDKEAHNLARAGGGGYFPLNAVQSFDPPADGEAEGRIRNGVYGGPVAFFFDGPFIWRQKQNMLEFTFTKVSAGVSGEYTYSRDIQAGDWKTVGVDTDTEVPAHPMAQGCLYKGGDGGGEISSPGGISKLWEISEHKNTVSA